MYYSIKVLTSECRITDSFKQLLTAVNIQAK